MYAVIKTGGKQYRVKPGDMLVVEKLSGEAGSEVSFDQVLMVGEGAEVTLGAPLVDGASVTATLVETRKGEKVKIFKKIRRQGYRRTRGHRQHETVLRVTAVAGAGMSESWDGTVDLTTRAVLNARARGLKQLAEELEGRSHLLPATTAAPAPEAAPAEAKAGPAPAAAEAPPAKPTRAKKAAAAEAPVVEATAAETAPDQAPAPQAAAEEPAAAPKPRARKPKPAPEGGEA